MNDSGSAAETKVVQLNLVNAAKSLVSTRGNGKQEGLTVAVKGSQLKQLALDKSDMIPYGKENSLMQPESAGLTSTGNEPAYQVR